jgi:molybdopterin molybdotransferase
VEPLAAVQRHVLAAVPAPRAEHVSLADALGHVLAEAVVATEAVPPFASSAMDGYAVRAADVATADAAAPVRLAVVDELPAGKAPTIPVGPGEAIRIMTGAPFPAGADAVVMVELTERDGDGGVLVRGRADAGDHVRRAGGDLEPGRVVFEPGTRIGPAHIGVMASLGAAEVAVWRRPRVGVLSTGDELVPVATRELGPGKIRDSNRPMLLALVAQAGCVPVDLGCAPDDLAAITAVVEGGLASCDALITSGGVSVGDFDLIRDVLDGVGDMRWWQVAIKPAKPFAFGLARGVPVFGLPGNPVSSHVSYELFARPGLRAMAGDPNPLPPVVPARAGSALRRRPDGKLHLDRVHVVRDGDALVATRTGDQASNVLSAMALANGLALLPDGDGVPAGGAVDVLLLDLPPGGADPVALAEGAGAHRHDGNDC